MGMADAGMGLADAGMGVADAGISQKQNESRNTFVLLLAAMP